ncbi:MAG: TonB-dependent receptor, partial [Hafnia sp.]
ENNEVSPYAVFGLSSTYTVNKNLSLTGGIENIFDKRQFRAGNAQTTGNAVTHSYMYGAGAQTYNEPGRTFYVSVNTSF